MGYPMNIGDAAEAAGVTAKMIRHYESLGLIPPAARTDAGYRQYTERDVAVLRFIRQSRSMGFSVKQVEQLLGLWADAKRESRQVKALARAHIAELDRKMSEMAQMKAALEPLAGGCHGDDRADCPILRTLANDAAVLPSAPAPRPAAKRPVTRRPAADAPVRHDDLGLVAWMRSVSRSTATADAL